MTDDFRGAAGGYGPFRSEAEPTAHLPVQSDAAELDQNGQRPPAGPGYPEAGFVTAEPSQPFRAAGEDPSDYPASPASAGDGQGPLGAGASTPPESHPYPPISGAGPATPYPQTAGADPGAPYPPTSGTDPGAPYPPTSGAGQAYPTHTAGSSGPPYFGASHPTSGPGHLDSYGLEADPWDTRFAAPTSGARLGPRIEPSPPPDRRRLIIGALAGLACGLLLFGTGGFLIGHATAAGPEPVPTQSPPPVTPSLPIYEQSQVAINQPKFPASLAALAQGWLPYLSACNRATANEGEKVRVRCTLDGMSAIFVEYNTVADRDKARVKALGQNVDARTLTPGVGAAVDKASPSGRTNGNYVEYAYKLTEGRAVRTVSGIRWDDAGTPVAGYLLAYWTDGIGSDWAPIRDLWARYA